MHTTIDFGEPVQAPPSTSVHADEPRTPDDRRSSHPTPAKRSNHGRGIQRLTHGLAIASIGLGLAELLIPSRIAQLVGVRDQRSVRRAMILMGLHELACGVGLLTARRRAPWLWLRLGGDVVDLAVLGHWRSSWRNDGLRVTAALATVAGVTVLHAVAARGNAQLGREPITTTAATTIARVPEEVYWFVRELRNLPRFMAHLASVEPIDDTRSHWKATGPGGIAVEWDAELTEDRLGEAIAWRSPPGARIDCSGTVRLVPAPGGRGTEIHVELRYAARSGRVGRALATLLGAEPEQQAHCDLQRLKQVLETGDIVHSDAGLHEGSHPAPEGPRVDVKIA